MSTELSKTYEPTSVELEALRVWNDEKLFHAEPTDPGEPYSIVIPPPNVTAALHLGHAPQQHASGYSDALASDARG